MRAAWNQISLIINIVATLRQRVKPSRRICSIGCRRVANRAIDGDNGDNGDNGASPHSIFPTPHYCFS